MGKAIFATVSILLMFATASPTVADVKNSFVFQERSPRFSDACINAARIFAYDQETNSIQIGRVSHLDNYKFDDRPREALAVRYMLNGRELRVFFQCGYRYNVIDRGSCYRPDRSRRERNGFATIISIRADPQNSTQLTFVETITAKFQRLHRIKPYFSSGC